MYHMEGETRAGWTPQSHHPYHCASCAGENDEAVLKSNRQAQLREAKMLAAEHAAVGNLEKSQEWQRRAEELE
jgi:hypothetical protein